MAKHLFVTLADKNYLDFAKQLCASAYFNSGWQGDYMLLAHEVPEEDLKWFIDKGIMIRHCKTIPLKAGISWSNIILSKFYIFKKEFKRWDKIIYMNADYVVAASLDDLLKVRTIAGTGCYRQKWLKRLRLKNMANGHTDSQKLGYNMNAKLVQSGLLAFDTSVIADDTFDKLIELAKKNQEPDKADFSFYSSDEAALNLYFNHIWEKRISMLYFVTYPYLIMNSYIPDWRITGIVLDGLYLTQAADHDQAKDLIIEPERFMAAMKVSPTFYAIWQKNFNRADSINLAKRLPATKRFSRLEHYYQEACALILIWSFWLVADIKELRVRLNKVFRHQTDSE